ncbi:apolipo protein O-domain-containing protein [Phycomyces blakesleeanus]|uniref:MICOS complex subunit n=2 Tax=Phycomyces blakesleeanus TaxID=4837 RepID=A0A167Q6G0_PHYB8|nr:hypothetical protein PHYBLDRAFT_184669 [Phycomyces blakesleeanus NRRL 1555(-)]OAD79156.1 hypothetical protein PHYBLDRAFT_184669 [Phycomyces blakesleeanus NRRL 1555(-)]|eukprot:XP_018297196.1 hypothetical protein PHYBLDRAFT_184669 [Phycomyces blakesleeanus NRRL 1555(-)]
MFSPVLRRSLVTAAATSAVVASSMPSTVYAEEKKLSIYDEPKPKVIIVESPTKLEEHVAYAQKYANNTIEEGKGHVDSLHQKLKNFENDVKATVRETVTDEDVLPNALYVGVAALAGTIIARKHNVVVRFLTSSALAYGAAVYLLPKTTHNIGVQAERLEQRYPELQSVHHSVDQVVHEVRQEVEGVLAQLRGAVDSNASSLASQFQSGLDKVKGETSNVESQVSAKVEQGKKTFSDVKKDVESMYSTRSTPAVEETLKKSKD